MAITKTNSGDLKNSDKVVVDIGIDNTPTADSNNLVTSDGIKKALDAKADKDNTYTKQEVDNAIAAAKPSDYDAVKQQVQQNTANIATNTGSISAINDKIPAQASAQNQLADKEFVNSSIATNTATFRGTYNLVTDLGLTVSATDEQVASAIAAHLAALVPPVVPENNDYCFVQVPRETSDPTVIDRIDRYKCTVTESGGVTTRVWGYEWSLNNSSFTAAQWAAINSGITAALVGQISQKADLRKVVATYTDVMVRDSDGSVMQKNTTFPLQPAWGDIGGEIIYYAGTGGWNYSPGGATTYSNVNADPLNDGYADFTIGGETVRISYYSGTYQDTVGVVYGNFNGEETDPVFLAFKGGTSIALGNGSKAVAGAISVAIGNLAEATGGIAIGAEAKTAGLANNLPQRYNVAIGKGALVDWFNREVLETNGYRANLLPSLYGNIAIGSGSKAGYDSAEGEASETETGKHQPPAALTHDAVAIGTGAVAKHDNSLALGPGAVSHGANTATLSISDLANFYLGNNNIVGLINAAVEAAIANWTIPAAVSAEYDSGATPTRKLMALAPSGSPNAKTEVVPSDIGALGNSGDQTLNGTLTATSFKSVPGNGPYCVFGIDSFGKAYIDIEPTGGAGVQRILIPLGDNNDTLALVSQIYAAVQQIAPAFDATRTSANKYAKNDLCSKDGVVYQCTALGGHYGAWNANNWTAKRASELFLPLTGGEMTGDLAIRNASIAFLLSGAIQARVMPSIFGSGLYISNGNSTANVLLPLNSSGTIALLQNLAADYSASATYTLNQLCVYDNKLYRCTTAITTAEAWTAAHWTEATVEDVLAVIRSALDAKAPLDSPAFTGTPTALTPTSGDDSTKVATTEFVQAAVAGKAAKVSGATSGNLAALDANGDLADSGKSAARVDNDAETAAFADIFRMDTELNVVANATPQDVAVAKLTELMGESLDTIYAAAQAA